LGGVGLFEVGFVSLKLCAAEITNALVIAGFCSPIADRTFVAGGVVVTVVGVGAGITKSVSNKLIPSSARLSRDPMPKTRLLHIFHVRVIG